jgi:hypothetical protein
MFEKILNGIDEASKFYKKVAEAFPKDNQISNACTVSMSCLEEMLGYMLGVIKQEKVPKLEGEIENWKGKLANCEKIFKKNEGAKAFIQSLYNLIVRIENLDKSKGIIALKEENALKEYAEQLGQIAKIIESPLQEIIDDSSKQMDIYRLKIMSYAGNEIKFIINSTYVSAELKPIYPIKPEINDEYIPELSNPSRMLEWINNPQIKFSIRSTAGIAIALVLGLILTGIILKIY